MASEPVSTSEARCNHKLNTLSLPMKHVKFTNLANILLDSRDFVETVLVDLVDLERDSAI